VLAPDVIIAGDGGGAVPAGRHPTVGAQQAARLIAGFFRRAEKEAAIRSAEPVLVNGALGLLVDAEFQGRRLRFVMAFAVADGRITGVFNLLNPAKLVGLPEPDARAGWPPRLE
jgi:RNA polymerase sigma-70 factor (ECF subfamily)